MSYSFPPSENDENDIRDVVSRVKKSHELSDLIRTSALSTVQRYAVTKEYGNIEDNIAIYIADTLCPKIEEIVLMPNISKTKDTWYQPRPVRRELKLYGYPSLLKNSNDLKKLKSFSEAVISEIYGKEDQDLIRIKSVGIRNMMLWTFWIDFRYFFDKAV